jgi:hypothetical protein
MKKRRRYDEEEERERKRKMDQAINSPATPSVSIVDIPPQECTPLMSIPRKFFFSSQVLKLDEVVVEVGEYYYNEKTKGIEKRSRKRKRGDTTLNQESN